MLCHWPVSSRSVTKLYRGLHWKYWREVFISSRVCNYDTAPIGNSKAVHARLAITTNFFGRFLLTTKHKRQGLNPGSSVHGSDMKTTEPGLTWGSPKAFCLGEEKKGKSFTQTNRKFFYWQLAAVEKKCFQLKVVSAATLLQLGEKKVSKSR